MKIIITDTAGKVTIVERMTEEAYEVVRSAVLDNGGVKVQFSEDGAETRVIQWAPGAVVSAELDRREDPPALTWNPDGPGVPIAERRKLSDSPQA